MVKKIFAVFLTFLLAALSASPAFSAEHTIKLAYLVAETQSTHVAARDFFKKTVEEKSGGRVVVELYPNGVLGGDRQVIEAVQLGTVQMTIPLAGVLSGFEPKFQLLDFPFLFKDKASVYKALDGELGDKLNSLLLPLGLRNLVFAENGFRHLANNRSPINKPEDLKGLKIRTIESPVQVAAFRALGASPTPMNFGELYTALQQKTVDAMESSTPLFYTSKFYEVQKYYSLTDLFYAATVVLINEPFFQSLPKDLQDIVQEAAELYRTEQRRISQEQENEMLGLLKDAGLVVNEISQEDRNLFREMTLPVYDEFKDVVGEDLIELARKASQ
ncbi:MAG: DctP family TRAP transporter solute-binding subunit [Synergistaceae bacterium]|jgi:tripartite ATP-independent transporter DctP family solute receptor|nr:DctP family TRAP transporter solute-binding subunit [Synergistaceae bacterium]